MTTREINAAISRLTTEYSEIEPEFRLLLGSGIDASQGSANEMEQSYSPIAPYQLRRSAVTYPLFDFQRDLIDEIVSLLDAPRGNRRGLVSLPTGAGKTRTAVSALFQMLRKRSQLRALWLAPSIELLRQAQEATVSLWNLDQTVPDVTISPFSNRSDETHKPEDAYIDFRTIQGLIGNTPDLPRKSDNYDVVIFDEAHHVAAPEFGSALKSIADNSTVIVGLTATPGRTNRLEIHLLKDLFNGNLLVASDLGEEPVSRLQSKGILAPVRYLQVPGSGSTSFAQRSVDTVRLLVKIGSNAPNQRSFVFAPSVSAAALIAAASKVAGLSADYVSGYMPLDRRNHALRRFEAGDLQVIANKSLLATGYDLPAVNNVILMSKIQSPILFEQIAGRISRGPAVGGNVVNTLWQFDDHLSLHGMPNSYERYKESEWSRDS